MKRLMQRYRSATIKLKLQIIIMTTVAVSLLLASSAVVVYDQMVQRAALREELGVMADILASSSTAALTFDDHKAVEELLNGLRFRRAIITAVMYSADGHVFASYHRDRNGQSTIPKAHADGSWFQDGRLRLFRTIPFENQPLGTLYVESDLVELYNRSQRFAGIVCGILLLTLLGAFWLSRRLQRTVSEPIGHLARAAKIVSVEKDYRTRAAKVSDDDLGQLTDTFNQMLEEIEHRDQELLRHRDNLERAVLERTAELAQLAAIVESADAAIISKSLDDKVLTWNPGAERIYGYSAEEAIGQTMSILIPQDRIEEDSALNEKVRRGESISHLETTRITKAGQLIHVLITLSPILDGNGNITAVALVVWDISQVKRLEQQLAHAQKLESIGQLAAGVAHEINTPIQYVGDNARFLEGAFTDLVRFAEGREPMALTGEDRATMEYLQTEIPKALGELIEGVDQVARIVRAMKEFSHPGPIEKMPIDINRAIESTITVSKNEWKYVADVTTDLDQDLPPVSCVAGEFNQVMLNLIVNAAHAIAEVAKASGTKGSIHICTRMAGPSVEIRVKDTGCGIPHTIRNKIFDPFFTTKPVGRGTGQGLAIAHSVIVQKHHGAIEVESEPGQGTTFVIQLPLERKLEAA